MCVLYVPYSHCGKAVKEKAQPWLESAVDLCGQDMQEPCSWFGLSWTLGQTLIQTLPNLSRRILEAWNGTFHSLLICSLGIFTAKHYISSRYKIPELFMAELKSGAVSLEQTQLTFLDVTGLSI